MGFMAAGGVERHTVSKITAKKKKSRPGSTSAGRGGLLDLFKGENAFLTHLPGIRRRKRRRRGEDMTKIK